MHSPYNPRDERHGKVHPDRIFLSCNCLPPPPPPTPKRKIEEQNMTKKRAAGGGRREISCKDPWKRVRGAGGEEEGEKARVPTVTINIHTGMFLEACCCPLTIGVDDGARYCSPSIKDTNHYRRDMY